MNCIRRSAALVVATIVSLAFVAMPRAASASTEEDPPAVALTGIQLWTLDNARDFNLIGCSYPAYWHAVEADMSFDVTPRSDRDGYEETQSSVSHFKGRLAVHQGSKKLGVVRFSSNSGLAVLNRSDLCALRSQGLGGPNTHYRVSVASATAVVETYYINQSVSGSYAGPYYDTVRVTNRPSTKTRIYQATYVPRPSYSRDRDQFTFSGRLLVQDGQGEMVPGPTGARLAVDEIFHGTAPYTFDENVVTGPGGRWTMSQTIHHVNHDWTSRVGAWTNWTGGNLAWFASKDRDGRAVVW